MKKVPCDSYTIHQPYNGIIMIIIINCFNENDFTITTDLGGGQYIKYN